MANMFKSYPEVVIFDATYKLNNRRMPVFLMMCIDGNGISEVICVWIIRSESRIAAETMLDAFTEFNPSYGNIKVFIADKDFADRVMFKEKFPEVLIQVCIFHALNTFEREVTCKKRNITDDQKEAALSILRCMVYSESFVEYSDLHQKLINLNLPAVTEYFEKKLAQ